MTTRLRRRARSAGRALAAGVLALALAACPPPEEAPPLDRDPPPDQTEVAPDPDDDTVIIVPPDVPPSLPPDPEVPPTEEPDPEREVTPVPPERVAEGTLGVSGTATLPVAVIRTDERESFGLTGPLSAELRRLSGARVRVEGRPAGTAVGPGIDVIRYEVLEIEGERPHVGILREPEPGGWMLELAEGPRVALEGLPEGARRPGAKLWVIGHELADGRFRVEAYGIVADSAREQSRHPRSPR